MKRDVFQELNTLHEEMNVSEEWLHECWDKFAQFNWVLTRMLKDPIGFPTMDDDEYDEEYKLYANNLNNSDIKARERVLWRFIDYCRWVSKST